MPVLHVKEIPEVSYKAWFTLTEDEKHAIADAINDLPGDCTVVPDEIEMTKLFGRNTPTGTVVFFKLYTDAGELPDDFVDVLEETLTNADIAKRVDNTRIPRDPAGEIFRSESDHDMAYYAGVQVEGKWNATQKIDHYNENV